MKFPAPFGRNAEATVAATKSEADECRVDINDDDVRGDVARAKTMFSFLRTQQRQRWIARQHKVIVDISCKTEAGIINWSNGMFILHSTTIGEINSAC